ncbi:hypothetical protein HRbin34_00104 [bacterium HR34]|nr:hypothetical protein HRbin34_00104 [bacterium HR34]
MIYKVLYDLVFIMAVVNVIMVLLLALSCRCIVGKKIYELLKKISFYNKIYQYHCLYWKIFFISVMIHGFIAIILYRTI